MKRAFLLSVSLIILANLLAQKTERDANYHFKSENYPVALAIYQDLYKSDTTNAELNYRLGVCYLNCNSNPKAALKHLQSIERSKADDPIFYFELGKAYLYNYQLTYANKSFTKAKQLAIKRPDFIQLIDVWLAMTENAKKLTKHPLDVSFINLGKYINSKMDELTPVITADGEFLLFTTNRKFDRTFNLYTYDVFYSPLADNAFKKGKSLSIVNSVDDEHIAGVSATGDKIFVQLQGYEAFEDIAISERTSRGFSKDVMLNSNVNSKGTENGACESISGDTLFFSSVRLDGKGGLDIYFSKKLPTGDWSIPIGLGDKINSQYDEDFPILSSDGKILYFCSNGLNSMGGFDIFKTNILPNGQFSEPKNIGYPLNDVFDNKTIAFSPNQRYAYVSAIRSGGFGYNDVYRVVFNQEDPSVKIFIFKMKTGNKEQNTEFLASDTTLTITAYTKGKVVIGKYAYDKKNSQATVALSPGAYTIEIAGKETESQSIKITVVDAPGKGKILKKNIFLKPK